MGVLTVVLAAALTAVGVGLIWVGFEARSVVSAGEGGLSLRGWLAELRLFQRVDDLAETSHLASHRPFVKILTEAGVRMRMSELVVISIGAALIGALIGWLILGVSPLIPVLAAALGILPREVIMRMASARERRIEAQLPAALLLIADTLRAGRSLAMAIEHVGRSARPPLGEEFTRASRQIAMGRPVEDAVAMMADRTGVRDLELLAASISVARVAGGDLPRLLNSMAAVARSRRNLSGQIRAMTAQAQATSLVLTLLPVMVGVVAYLAAPDYFRPMLTTPGGWGLLFVAGVLIATGQLIMRGIIARQMR